MFSRRRFLQTSSLLSLSPILPTILANTARAATAAADERVLVVIQIGGGNDGLNTVVPYADDLYGRARNKLRLKTDKLHKLDDQVALHPRMKAAKELFDDGRLSIVAERRLSQSRPFAFSQHGHLANGHVRRCPAPWLWLAGPRPRHPGVESRPGRRGFYWQ